MPDQKKDEPAIRPIWGKDQLVMSVTRVILNCTEAARRDIYAARWAGLEVEAIKRDHRWRDDVYQICSDAFGHLDRIVNEMREIQVRELLSQPTRSFVERASDVRPKED